MERSMSDIKKHVNTNKIFATNCGYSQRPKPELYRSILETDVRK